MRVCAHLTSRRPRMAHPHPLQHVSVLVIGLMSCSEMLLVQTFETYALQIGVLRIPMQA